MRRKVLEWVAKKNAANIVLTVETALVTLVILVLIIIIAGCTAQQRARSYGGTVTVDLPEGERLVTATWKDDDLWYLTRPRTASEAPTAYQFRESKGSALSSGISGTVVFKEH